MALLPPLRSKSIYLSEAYSHRFCDKQLRSRAAISAARMGRQVVVAESQGCFGGAATNALVPAFMSFDNGVDFLAGGIGREVYDRCIQKKGICLNGNALGIHPEKLKQIYDDMMIASGAKVSFFTQLIDVFAENGRVFAKPSRINCFVFSR